MLLIEIYCGYILGGIIEINNLNCRYCGRDVDVGIILRGRVILK